MNVFIQVASEKSSWLPLFLLATDAPEKDVVKALFSIMSHWSTFTELLILQHESNIKQMIKPALKEYQIFPNFRGDSTAGNITINVRRETCGPGFKVNYSLEIVGF